MRALCVADLAVRPNLPAAWRIRRIRKQASSAAAMRRQHNQLSNDVQRVSGTATHFYTKKRSCSRGRNGTTDVTPEGLAHVYIFYFILGFKLRGRAPVGEQQQSSRTNPGANHGDQTPRHLKQCFGPPPAGLPACPCRCSDCASSLSIRLPRPESLSRIAPAPTPQSPLPLAREYQHAHFTPRYIQDQITLCVLIPQF